MTGTRRTLIKRLTGLLTLGAAHSVRRALDPYNNQLEIVPMPLQPEAVEIVVQANVLFEGFVPYIYLDVYGFPTVGYGFVLKKPEHALRYSWFQKSTGRPAPVTMVRSVWEKINSMADYIGKSADKFSAHCPIVMSQTSAMQAMRERITENYLTFCSQQDKDKRIPFREFGSYPANAQVAMLSMSWGAGVAGVVDGFPTFTRYIHDAMNPLLADLVRANAWEGAARECALRVKGKSGQLDNKGVIPRNNYNKALLKELAKQMRVRSEYEVSKVTPSDIKRYAYPEAGESTGEVANV